MLQFESFSLLNEEVNKVNPDMLAPDAKIPHHSDIEDFTKNLGAMHVEKDKNTGIVKMSCYASDYRIKGFYTREFWGKFPKGLIHFNFKKYDYSGFGTEDQEIEGANYVSDTGKYTLLIIND